jgi:hypothetical protein
MGDERLKKRAVDRTVPHLAFIPHWGKSKGVSL